MFPAVTVLAAGGEHGSMMQHQKGSDVLEAALHVGSWPHLPSTAPMAHTSLQEQVQSVQDQFMPSMLQLAAAQRGNPGNLSEVVFTYLGKISNFTKLLIEEVKQLHDADVKLASDGIKEIKVCHVPTLTNKVGQLAKSTAANGETFDDCRVQEKSDFVETLDAATGACVLYRGAAKEAQACISKVAFPDHTWSHDNYKENLKSWSDCSPLTRKADDLLTKCEARLTKYSSRVAKCKGNQESFEQTACLWHIEAASVCDPLDACRKVEIANYDSNCLAIDSRVVSRKATLGGLCQMKCFADTMADRKFDEESLKKCDKSCSGVKDISQSTVKEIWELKCQSTPEAPLCTRPVLGEPGTKSWADEYRKKDWYTVARNEVLSAKEISEYVMSCEIPMGDYDTGWFSVEKDTNYDKTHDLGEKPLQAMIWGASDCGGSDAFLMDSTYDGQGYGAWLQRVTKTDFRLSTGKKGTLNAQCIRLLLWGGNQSSLPPADHDSGWFQVGKGGNYDKEHNLGELPLQATIWAASDCDGNNVNLMDGIYSGTGGYGGWLQRITENKYRISTGPHSATSGYGKEEHWQWDDGTGCLRVLMWGGASSTLPAADHDSGWFPVAKAGSYSKTHGLGQLPAQAFVWAASDCAGKDAYLMDGITASYQRYGCWLEDVDSNQYKIVTGAQSAMSGYGVDDHWQVKGDHTGAGCARVVMWK